MGSRFLLYLESETIVSIFKVSTASNKDAILVEHKKILTNAKAMAQIESMDLSKTLDFSLKPEVLIGKTLPLINLCIQNAQLKRQDIVIFNKLLRKV
jgi:hypothetical protein